MRKTRKISGYFIAASFLALCATFTSAQNLRVGHPDEYVVQKGDTLWDISETFLDDPWMWPEIWHINEQIANPHLIYPGDVLRLVYIDGKPQLVMDRGIVKLSPEVRSTTHEEAIDSVPLDSVRDFFSKNQVLSEEELENAPYMVAGPEGRILVGQGDTLYARGSHEEGVSVYGIYRIGDKYRDPVTGDILGVRAEAKGTARYQNKAGEIMRMSIMESYAEISTGDRFLPLQQDQFDPQIFPMVPDEIFSAQIISVEGGVTQIGLLDVVAINAGTDKNLQVGHLMAIMEAGEKVRDRVAGQTIKLPDEQAGALMVFKVYERMSFGLVLRAEKALSVGFQVSSLFSQEAYDRNKDEQAESERSQGIFNKIKGVFDPDSRSE